MMLAGKFFNNIRNESIYNPHLTNRISHDTLIMHTVSRQV